MMVKVGWFFWYVVDSLNPHNIHQSGFSFRCVTLFNDILKYLRGRRTAYVQWTIKFFQLKPKIDPSSFEWAMYRLNSVLFSHRGNGVTQVGQTNGNNRKFKVLIYAYIRLHSIIRLPKHIKDMCFIITYNIDLTRFSKRCLKCSFEGFSIFA